MIAINLQPASIRRGRSASLLSIVAVLACWLFSSIGLAQESADNEEPFDFDPELGLELRYDENIFQSATGVLSSWITILSPGLSIRVKPTKHLFTFDYDGDVAWYSASDPDNYDDHYFKAGVNSELGTRVQFDLEASYDDAHENRGTGLTEGFIPSTNVPPEPDEFNLGQVLSRFSLGSTGAKGRLVFEAGYSDLEYTNHTDRTRFYNRDHGYGDVAFFFRVMPSTSLLVDARFTEIDYQHDLPVQPGLNSTEQRYRIGMTWETTAQTRGTVKVGYFWKDFADDAREDFGEPSWDVDIRWSPRTYSHFDFRTARYPSETNAGGDYVRNTANSISWEHNWTNRVTSRLAVRDLNQEYPGSNFSRSQDLKQYTIFLTYQMRRWLEFKAGAVVNSRTSTIDTLVFDGNVYSISARLTL